MSDFLLNLYPGCNTVPGSCSDLRFRCHGIQWINKARNDKNASGGDIWIDGVAVMARFLTSGVQSSLSQHTYEREGVNGVCLIGAGTHIFQAILFKKSGSCRR